MIINIINIKNNIINMIIRIKLKYCLLKKSQRTRRIDGIIE